MWALSEYVLNKYLRDYFILETIKPLKEEEKTKHKQTKKPESRMSNTRACKCCEINPTTKVGACTVKGEGKETPPILEPP